MLARVGDAARIAKGRKRAKSTAVKDPRQQLLSDGSDIPTSPPLRRKFRRVRQLDSSDEGASDRDQHREVDELDSLDEVDEMPPIAVFQEDRVVSPVIQEDRAVARRQVCDHIASLCR